MQVRRIFRKHGVPRLASNLSGLASAKDFLRINIFFGESRFFYESTSLPKSGTLVY